MSNREIIETESNLRGFEYNGKNLFTFQEWKKQGYTVCKGEKAFIKTTLWKPVTKTNKEGKEEKLMIMVKANLFNIDQVKRLEA